MNVDWDETKRLKNIEDHGVDFQDAALIFLNPVLRTIDTQLGIEVLSS